MDSLDLLAREDEFKKLNKQLEKKSESLLKEIEHVMQKPDFFTEFSHNLTLTPQHTLKSKHCCNTPKQTTPEHSTPTRMKTTPKKSPKSTENVNQTANSDVQSSSHNDGMKKVENVAHVDGNVKPNTESMSSVCDCCSVSRTDRINGDLGFLYAFVSIGVQEKVLPQSFMKDRVTVEGVCKFLLSKVKLMQEQMDKLQSTINIKASQCDAHLTQHAELESERMTLLNRTNNLKASTIEMKSKCMMLQKKLEEKEGLYKEQRSETDRLTSEVKRLRSKNASVEARSAMQEETISNLKHQLELTKRSEKEFRDATRNLSSSHESAIAALESRCRNMSTRANKQAELVDNLRKQNALLSARGAMAALDRQYSELLTSDT